MGAGPLFLQMSENNNKSLACGGAAKVMASRV